MKDKSERAENEDLTIRLYILIAHTVSADLESLSAFSDRLAKDAAPILQEATSTSWQFYLGEPHRLESADDYFPSGFLQEAHLQMVQSPADIVMVTLTVLLIEWWLFPADYISSWFQGRGFTVTWFDRFHLALVLSTLGTLSGALGGGLHGKEIIRELGLFLPEP